MSKPEDRNPLLDDPGESATGEEGKKETGEKKAKATASPEAKLKADAIAKFPKDVIAQTKYILKNSPHTNFIVPMVEGEIGIEEVQINGYKLTIQRGAMVNIPIQVAKIIAEKYRINLDAGKEMRVDREKKVSEALG